MLSILFYNFNLFMLAYNLDYMDSKRYGQRISYTWHNEPWMYLSSCLQNNLLVSFLPSFPSSFYLSKTNMNMVDSAEDSTGVLKKAESEYRGHRSLLMRTRNLLSTMQRQDVLDR